MESDVCLPPQKNVLDLTYLGLCEKCECALWTKLLKMYNGTVIDNNWNQEDIDMYIYETTKK